MRCPVPPCSQAPNFFPVVQTSVPTQQRLIGQNNPTAASMPSGGEMPPLAIGTIEVGNPRQAIQVTAGDGTQMNGDLYMAFSDTPAPGLLMLAPDRTAWVDLPLRLQATGFTVMAMDLRPNAVVGDVDAMLRALTQMETVDAGHMGVIGAEMGADVGLVACAQGSPCDVLVMLSPQQEINRDRGDLAVQPAPAVHERGAERRGIRHHRTLARFGARHSGLRADPRFSAWRGTAASQPVARGYDYRVVGSGDENDVGRTHWFAPTKPYKGLQPSRCQELVGGVVDLAQFRRLSAGSCCH